MKKIILLSIYIFIFSSSLYSQSNWSWQNPIPQGNDYTMVKFLNYETGYAVGLIKAVVKTTNGGLNWTLINNGILNDTIRCIHIFDPGNVIIGGSSLYRTTNGGENWIFLSSINTRRIFFINNNTGFAIDNAVIGETASIIKTTNGGLNWTNQTFSEMEWRDIYFISEQTGFVTGKAESISSGVIYRTTNQGSNWNPIYNITSDNYLSGIDFINDNTGFILGRYNIIKTTNKGQNWFVNRIINLFSVDQEYNINFISNDSGFISQGKSQNKFFRTMNNGISWDSLKFEGTLTSFNFLNYNSGYLVGLGGIIYKTTNAGNNWILQSSQYGNLGTLSHVNFPNQNTGYIFGSNNKIFKTTNQGINWDISNFGNNYYVSSSFLNADSFYIGCGDNVVLRTVNGGINWDSLSIPSSISSAIGGIYFKNFNTGFASSYHKIFKTTNSGDNWSEIYSNPIIAPIFSLQFINDLIGYFFVREFLVFPLTTNSYFYKTTNGGLSWFRTSHLPNIHISSLIYISQDTAFAPSRFYSSMVLKTTDGGYYWNNVLNTQSNCLGFLPPSTVYVPGYKSTNLGNTWLPYEMVLQDPLRATSLQFINDNTGFMVGTNGAILKTTNGGGVISNVFNLNQSSPEYFSLQQNYPNPFNPSTKINYDLKNSSFITLKVYDIMGREIATLVKQAQQAGSYSIDFKSDKYGLSSGIYFYILRTDNFSQTRKMILTK